MNLFKKKYFRGKGAAVSDTQFATSLAFDSVGKETFLYALYRDDQIRMWSTKTGQCVSTVSCLQEGMESRAQGRKFFYYFFIVSMVLVPIVVVSEWFYKSKPVISKTVFKMKLVGAAFKSWLI